MQSEAIRHAIFTALRKVRPSLTAPEVSDATTLAELGIDSIRLIEVGIHLEDLLESAISFDEWLDQEAAREVGGFSVGSLSSYIAAAVRR